MSKVSRGYIDEAANRFASEGAGFAIWLIENAVAAADEDKSELLRIEYFTEKHISQKEINETFNNIQESLKYALHMLEHPTGMDGDEWMLIITYISGAEAFVRFAKRRGSPSEFPLLDATLMELSTATDNYANSSFRQQLHEALGRHPYLPLPSILLAQAND